MHGFQQVQEYVGVVLEAFYGILPAISHRAVGRQMDGEVRANVLDQGSDGVRIEEIQPSERKSSRPHDGGSEIVTSRSPRGDYSHSTSRTVNVMNISQHFLFKYKGAD